MRGRFIGKTSMGFVTGKVYELRSDIKTIAKNGHYIQPCICLYDEFSDAWCPYSSLENVLKNWDFGSSEASAKVKTKMPYLFERFQGKCFTSPFFLFFLSLRRKGTWGSESPKPKGD